MMSLELVEPIIVAYDAVQRTVEDLSWDVYLHLDETAREEKTTGLIGRTSSHSIVRGSFRPVDRDTEADEGENNNDKDSDGSRRGSKHRHEETLSLDEWLPGLRATASRAGARSTWLPYWRMLTNGTEGAEPQEEGETVVEMLMSSMFMLFLKGSSGNATAGPMLGPDGIWRLPVIEDQLEPQESGMLIVSAYRDVIVRVA